MKTSGSKSLPCVGIRLVELHLHGVLATVVVFGANSVRGPVSTGLWGPCGTAPEWGFVPGLGRAWLLEGIPEIVLNAWMTKYKKMWECLVSCKPLAQRELICSHFSDVGRCAGSGVGPDGGDLGWRELPDFTWLSLCCAPVLLLPLSLKAQQAWLWRKASVLSSWLLWSVLAQTYRTFQRLGIYCLFSHSSQLGL